MSRVIIFGATGSLGRHVVRQAVAANHDVSVVVRTPSKLPADILSSVTVHQRDLNATSAIDLATILSGHNAAINAAGLVSEGQVFVDLLDRLVTGLEALPVGERPVCWFMAGAGLLDLDRRGRRGVDLPRIASTYWPHRVNFERIRNTDLDWRVLCPGPMVDQQPLGIARLRTSLDRLPVEVPAVARVLPGALVLPLFAYLVPEMIISYADAASLMLANLAPGGSMSRRRVGLALPSGMRGKKDHWVARPRSASQLIDPPDQLNAPHKPVS